MRPAAAPVACADCPLRALSHPTSCPFLVRATAPGAVLRLEAGSAAHVRRGRFVVVPDHAGELPPSGTLAEPGATMGLLAALGDAPTWEAVSIDPGEVCVLPASELRRILASGSPACRTLFAKGLHEASQTAWAAVRGRSSAAARLAALLDDGAPDLAGVPHHLLAVLVGVRPETLSRLLARLRSQGLLAPGGLVVADPPRLRRLARG